MAKKKREDQRTRILQMHAPSRSWFIVVVDEPNECDRCNRRSTLDTGEGCIGEATM